MKRSDVLEVWGLGVLGSGQFEDAVYLLWLKIQSHWLEEGIEKGN